MRFTYELMEMPLEFPFGITHGITETAQTVRVEISIDYSGNRYTGLGEAVPSTIYDETPKTVISFYKEIIQQDLLKGLTPYDIDTLEKTLNSLPDHYAAKAAIDIAFWDLQGKIENKPLYELWQLNPKDCPKTSYTIGLANLEEVERKTTIALSRGYDVLKLKLGGDCDKEALKLVRQLAPNATLRTDANAAWTTKEAMPYLELMAELSVEFVEEPLLLSCSHKDSQWLKSNSPVEIMADERCHRMNDILQCSELFHSINLKPTKTGGLTEAKRMIKEAKAQDLKIMLGGFTESSISVTAFGHLAPLVDYCDLDACLLLAKDPYEGITYTGSQFTLPNRPGIGIIKRV